MQAAANSPLSNAFCSWQIWVSQNYFFKGRMTPLTRYYKFSIRWIETKNAVWHCYVITLIWLKMSFLLWVIPLSFLPFLFFCCFFFLDVQYINILSCLELRTFQTIPEKNNLFLARLVVHFCCHIHSCLACDVRPCSLALCYVLATHLNISPSCFFERAEQWQGLAPLHSWSQSGIVTESHAALYIS